MAFKAVKAMLLTVLGVTLLFGIHRDPVDMVIRIAQAVHLPLTSHVLDLALNIRVVILLLNFAVVAYLWRRKEAFE